MGTVDALTEYENEHIGERQSLPKRYLGLSVEEMDRRIAAARATLGQRLVVLGHHYQRDEVIKFADYTATRGSCRSASATIRTPSSSSSAASTSWPRARTSWPRRTSR